MTSKNNQVFRRHPSEFVEVLRFGLPPETERRASETIPGPLDRLAMETAAVWKWNDNAAAECDLSKVDRISGFYEIAVSIQVAANKVCELSRGRAEREKGVWQLAVSQDNEEWLNIANHIGLTVRDWVIGQFPGIKIPIDPSVSRRAEVSWLSPDRCFVFSVPVTLEPLPKN